MADPLSIAAGVLALVTAAAQVGKAISRLRHFGEVPGKIYALKNDISELEIVLRQVANAIKQGLDESHSEHQSLIPVLSRTKDRLADLARSLDRIATACEGSKVKAVAKTTIWWREKTVLQEIHWDILSVKASLNLLLATANSQDLQHIILELRRVTLEPGASQQSQPRLCGPIHPPHTDSHLASIVPVCSQFEDVGVSLNDLKQTLIHSQPPSTITGSALASTHSKETDIKTVRVVASQRAPCRSWCPCVCHMKRKTKLASPEMTGNIIGRLFVGYSGIPVLSKPCNFQGCRDKRHTTATVEYWFPWWFASMNLRFQLTLLSRSGPQLQLSVIRRIADDSPSIDCAMKGDIDGLKRLFAQGLAGPRDVSNSRGYSLIRWALYGGMHNHQTVKFLISEGAVVDEISYDNVWDFVFRGKVNANQKHELRCITEGGETDWVEDQNFPLIHRIIFGLSQKSLIDELQENPHAVYATDSQNRTALDWATARVQLDDMALLIAHGADPNNMDVTGRTPVLHAVDSHNAACLRLILEAGGNPDPVMPKGIFRSSALTATGFAGITEMLKLLLQHEANPNACNPEGMTALHAVARTHNVECALLLLEWGADLNAMSSHGRTPLTTAIVSNNHPVLRLFVDRCYDYLTTMRFQGPQILQVIAEHADIETMNIIASSNPLNYAYDLNAHNLATYQEILQKRSDFNEKLLVAFNELISIAKANEVESKSLDSVTETGLFFSAKVSFHSDLSEAIAKLESEFNSPTSSILLSPVSPSQRERMHKNLKAVTVDAYSVESPIVSPRNTTSKFAGYTFGVSPTGSEKEITESENSNNETN